MDENLDISCEEFGSSEDFEFETGAGPGRTLPPEKRLSSPIINRLCQRILDLRELAESKTQLKTHGKRLGKDTTRKDRYNLLASSCPELFYSSVKRPFMQLAEMSEIMDSEPELLDPSDYPFLFRSATPRKTAIKHDYNAAKRVYAIAVDSFCSSLSDTLKHNRIASLKAALRLSEPDLDSIAATNSNAQLWSTIVDEYRQCVVGKRHTPRWRRHGPVEVTYGSDFAALRYNPDEQGTRIRLATYEQLQMIQDAVQGRHSIRMALQLNLHNGNQNLSSHVDFLVAWQDSCLAAYGNDGYELVKAPEAIFKTRLNTLTGGDIFAYSSFERTLDKLKKKELKLSDTPRYMTVLGDFANRMDDIGNCVELFGLIKVSGHPCVYAEKSANSVKTEALPRGTTTVYYMRMLTRCFKHMVLSGFISKHGTWPPLTTLPLRGTTLRRHYNNRVSTLPLNSYPLSELDNVEFGKFVDFDYSEDYLKFLDDKAICPGATEISNFWFGGMRAEPRRLLTKITSMPHFDTRELVERMRHSRTTREEEVVELTQKERELKNAARCFCKLTFEVRSFFTLTEYNLGEHFMKDYCPQQTMTMSESQVKHRLYSMVRDARLRNKVLLEVDFSRWNLRWRDDTVRPIARILEDVFGLPGVFSQAHPFFSRATIVLTDKHSLPAGAMPGTSVHDWPESELLWRNHLGGFEGIQQKLWTLCTIAMMYVCIYDSNVSFVMAGQGDNQIFALTFNSSTKETTRDLLRKLLATMEVRCFYLNHEVKPEECIDSSTVLTYSKEIYVAGVHRTYALKFLARTLNVSDNDVPSISRELSGISANSVMCADSLPLPFKGCFWMYFQILQEISYRLRSPLHLLEHRSLRQLFRSSASMLSFCLLLPGSLGGLPIQSWGRFFMKGEVDSLSWDVAAVRLTSRHHQALAADTQLLLDAHYAPDKPNRTSLILDPHSIPISRPKDQSRLIKEHISKCLPAITKNHWIFEIINSNTESAGKAYLTALANSTPLQPKILHDLYNYSPAGVRDAMLSRFNMTRTIALVAGSESFLSEIQAGNLQLYRFLYNRHQKALLQKTHPMFFNVTPFDMCTTLRKQWGNDVHHSNIGTYTPFDFNINLHYIDTARISVTSRTQLKTFTTEVGPYPPNFGTKTRAKVSDHGFKIVTSSSTVGDLRALCIIYSELGATSYAKQLIEPLVSARSPWSLSELLPIMPSTFGGTAAHRHNQLQQSAFSVLGSRTVPTHLNFCADESGILAGGVLDYPVAFQEHYLFLTSLSQHLCNSDPDDGAGALSISIPAKLVPVSTESLVERDPSSPHQQNLSIQWPAYIGNALIYVTSLQFKSIPLVPSNGIIPHSSRQRSTQSLIFSHCLTRSKITRASITEMKHAIIHPIEALDLAEFLNCEPGDIMQGLAAYVATEAVYQAVRLSRVTLTDELRGVMMRIALGVSGGFGRLFLLDQAAHERFSTSLGLIMMPGTSGADLVSSRLAGELVNQAMLLLVSRELTTNKFEFVVFEDTTNIAHIAVFKIALTWLAEVYNDKLRIKAEDRLQLVVSQARMDGESRSIAAAEALINSTKRWIQASTARRFQGNVEGPKVTYWNTSVMEALRTLRTRVRLPRLLPITHDLGIRKSTTLGQCKVTKVAVYGSLASTPAKENTPELQRLEVVMHRMMRHQGRISTAISFWATILPSILPRIPRKLRCHSVGVGHGAVASTLLTTGMRVVGFDLRNSFPRIVQREETYKPPECRLLQSSDDFTWSHAVFDFGGDLFDPGVSNAVFDQDALVIIDIESSNEKMVDLIGSVKHRCHIILRYQGTIVEAQELLSLVHVIAVYNCTILRRLEKQNWILVFETHGLETSAANSERVKIEVQRRFRLRIDKSLTAATERINDFVRETGYEVKEATLPELRLLATTIRRTGRNSNDNQLMTRYEELADVLDDCVTVSSMDDATDVVHYFAQPHHRSWRVVASYVGLTRTDIEDIIEIADSYTPLQSI